MSRGFSRTLAELINPNWVRHPTVPPLEAGLRPNGRLDEAKLLAVDFEVDDLVKLDDGRIAMSHGSEIHWLEKHGQIGPGYTFSGHVMALGVSSDGLLAAIEGEGLVRIDWSGSVTVLDDAEQFRRCVTAVCELPDGRLVVAIGSTGHPHSAWSHALVANDATGSVVLLSDDGSAVLAANLPWPSGLCADGEDGLILSLSLGHRIEKMSLTSKHREIVLRNLPAFPGRLTAHPTGWVVAFPYVRNRLSELLLEEREFVDEMVRTISSDEWMVPRLRNENPYTSALQLGQLRVLGALKPWAPARSYGLLAVLDQSGRIASSYHSRVDGSQHGVTAAVWTDRGIITAVRGSRSILTVKERVS